MLERKKQHYLWVNEMILHKEILGGSLTKKRYLQKKTKKKNIASTRFQESRSTYQIIAFLLGEIINPNKNCLSRKV